MKHNIQFCSFYKNFTIEEIYRRIKYSVFNIQLIEMSLWNKDCISYIFFIYRRYLHKTQKSDRIRIYFDWQKLSIEVGSPN